MISHKYFKCFFIILILILVYNLFFNYKHSLIEGMVTNAKEICLKKLKDCAPPKDNKNPACGKIEKDSSGNYYQVCPSDNPDKNCGEYCPWNWKFEVDSSGNYISNSTIKNIENENYWNNIDRQYHHPEHHPNYHNHPEYNKSEDNHPEYHPNYHDDFNNKNKCSNPQIISINLNSGLDSFPSSKNLLQNNLPFTRNHKCIHSTTGAFTDCGPLPYNSSGINNTVTPKNTKTLNIKL